MILSALSTISLNQIVEFDRLVLNGFDIESDFSGSKPINEVCRYGYEQFLLYLIHKGADFNTKDWLDRSPLMICMENDHLECFKILVENGAIYGIEIQEWKNNSELFKNSENKKYLINLVQKLNWNRRKSTVFCYSLKKLNLPPSIFRELIGYL